MVVAKLLRTVLRNLINGLGDIEILGRFGKGFERIWKLNLVIDRF